MSNPLFGGKSSYPAILTYLNMLAVWVGCELLVLKY